jgi:hypothetical protein
MSWLPGFHHVSISLLGIGIFLAAFFTVAQFSFWGNYLPHVYPVHLRGTGESFAANIGGRMFGTPFAFVTQQIAILPFIPGATTFAKTGQGHDSRIKVPSRHEYRKHPLGQAAHALSLVRLHYRQPGLVF